MNTKIRITDVLQNILVCNMIFSLEVFWSLKENKLWEKKYKNMNLCNEIKYTGYDIKIGYLFNNIKFQI